MSPRDLRDRFEQEAPLWREQYARPAAGGAYNAKLYRRGYVLELLGPGRGVCLDLGCGAGPFLAPIAELGYRPVGLDFAAGMLRLAREEAGRAGAPGVLRGDCRRLPFADGAAAAVVAVGLLEYLPADRPFLAELRRVLAPGGRAVVTLRNRACAERRRWQFYRRLGVAVVDTDYFFREHLLEEFLALAGEEGLAHLGTRLCHFYPLPWPLSRLLPGLAARRAHAREARLCREGDPRLASTLVVGVKRT